MVPRGVELLPFKPGRRPGGGIIGCVHVDGSITFQGRHYESIRDVPASCRYFRADLASTLQWRRLYRAVAPKRAPGRPV